MRKKKPVEIIKTIYKNPELSLFDKNLSLELKQAIENKFFKMTQLSSDTFPKQLRLDKILLSINADKPEVIQWCDAPEYDDNTGGATSYYLKLWKASAAGFINKDVRQKRLDKYYILTFSTQSGIKKALIRSLYDEITAEMSPEEYKNLVLKFTNNNILNLIIDDINYCILKIIPINGLWTSRQKLYDDFDLVSEYTITEMPDESSEEDIYFEDEQYELF